MSKKITIRKKLEDFVKDENGFASKEKILKIGLGTISTLAIMGNLSTAHAQLHTSTAPHTNGATIGVKTAPCPDVAHSNHASHASHSSHASIY